MAKEKQVKKSREVEILPCSCKNAYQDKRYGVGKRVMNPKSNDDKYRCTVCGAERSR